MLWSRPHRAADDLPTASTQSMLSAPLIHMVVEAAASGDGQMLHCVLCQPVIVIMMLGDNETDDSCSLGQIPAYDTSSNELFEMTDCDL